MDDPAGVQRGTFLQTGYLHIWRDMFKMRDIQSVNRLASGEASGFGVQRVVNRPPHEFL